MGQYLAPDRFKPDQWIFYVGRDDRGCWVVQETHGLLGGVFVSREDAVHYAQDESRQHPGSIVLLTPNPAELAICRR